jgi:uncharacterized protein YjiS (DUF1127 family)
MFKHSAWARWRVMRRRRRADRNLVEACRHLDDHLLKDIGLKRPRSAGDPWL